MDQIIQLLKNSRHVLLTTHIYPDGDALGSLIALGYCLDALDKTSTWYNESPIPAVYRFLPSVERIENTLTDLHIAYDTAVVVDCGDLKRTGKIASTIDRIPVVIDIDHHVTSHGFGSIQLIDPTACSTAEIIYRLIKAMDIVMDRNIATAIYTGILTDTGSFRFSNTNKSAFEICDEMLDFGVDPYTVAKHVYGTYSLERIRLFNLALDTIEISEDSAISLMTVTQDMLDKTGTHVEDLDGLINYARRIQDVKMAALIQEDVTQSVSGGVKTFHVGLRSNGAVDVSAIASLFAGGGHFGAAGFTIQSTLAELKRLIFSLSDKF